MQSLKLNSGFSLHTKTPGVFVVIGRCDLNKAPTVNISFLLQLPEASARIAQACWDMGRLRRTYGPPWPRPLKSTTVSVKFYHQERRGPSLRAGSGRAGEAVYMSKDLTSERKRSCDSLMKPHIS